MKRIKRETTVSGAHYRLRRIAALAGLLMLLQLPLGVTFSSAENGETVAAETEATESEYAEKEVVGGDGNHKGDSDGGDEDSINARAADEDAESKGAEDKNTVDKNVEVGDVEADDETKERTEAEFKEAEIVKDEVSGNNDRETNNEGNRVTESDAAITEDDGIEEAGSRHEEMDEETDAEEPGLLEYGLNPGDEGYEEQLWLAQHYVWDPGVTSVAAQSAFRLRAPSRDDPSLGEPAHSKTLTPNTTADGTWDGTYTLSLDVTGRSSTSQERTKADIIVIQDTSGSMNSTRMSDAKTALRELGSLLFAQNTSEYPDTIRMSLMTFATHAQSPQTGMQTESAFQTAVNALPTSGSGGTNWEEALANANTIATREDAEVYVIFVSDGLPTFRNSRGGYSQYYYEGNVQINDWRYLNTWNVYGTGSDGRNSAENIRRSYEQAVDDAQRIVDAGKYLYTVSTYTDNVRMRQLVEDVYGAGNVGNRYQIASNTDALKQAFSNIVQDIMKQTSYTNVSITDRMSAAASLAGAGGAANFTYYKNGVPWTDAPAATYSPDTGVVWDLSSVGKLEPDVTYRVSFTVWPNQETWDHITAFQNGDEVYDPEQYPDIVQNVDGTYSIYSNASGTLQYSQVTTTNGQDEVGDPQTATYPRPTMTVYSAEMTVEKVWDDAEDPSQRPVNPDGTTVAVEITILQDGEEYRKVTLSEENDWKETFAIAPGLISTSVSSEPLTAGHVYTVSEVGVTPRYELIAEEVHPMMVDGVLQYGGNNDAVLTATNRLLPGPVNVLPATGSRRKIPLYAGGAVFLAAALWIALTGRGKQRVQRMDRADAGKKGLHER